MFSEAACYTLEHQAYKNYCSPMAHLYPTTLYKLAYIQIEQCQ